MYPYVPSGEYSQGGFLLFGERIDKLGQMS